MPHLRVLILASTGAELATVRAEVALLAQTPEGEWLDCLHLQYLVTGIGAANTAWALGTVADQPWHAWLMVGIAGSYSPRFPLASVAQVSQECWADLGAEEADGSFLDLEHLGFPSLEQGEQRLYNVLNHPAPWPLALPLARAITVNTATGTEATRQQRLDRWQPELENMEGAAFFAAAHRRQVRFCQLRAVSNWVEVRNRAAWQIGPALNALGPAALEALCWLGKEDLAQQKLK